MTSPIEARLKEAGLTLPPPAPVAGTYAPFRISGGQVFISGQVPFDGKNLTRGIIGEGLDEEQGYEAARLCGLNLLAQLKEACGGDLSRASRCLQLRGFVVAGAGFGNHPQIINGASDLMVLAFGEENGRHARAAVGAAHLPLGVPVEVEGIFELA